MKVLLLDFARKEFSTLDLDIQEKFGGVFRLIQNRKILDPTVFKKLSGSELYEVRVKHNTNIYRAVGGIQKSKYIIVLFFQKKTQRTPIAIIKLANKRFGIYRNNN